MSYSKFKTISQIQEKFGVTVKESENLFVDTQSPAPSTYLAFKWPHNIRCNPAAVKITSLRRD